MSQEATGTEFDEELQPATTTRQTTRNGKGGRKVTQVTKREFIEPTGDDDEKVAPLPGMFALSDIEEHSIVRIRVYRKDPDEGMLGYLEDPNASEDEVSQRWGGGQFRIDGLNQTGRIMATRTFRLAGDPIFVSDSARVQWEKRTGLRSGGGQPQQQAMSMQDMLTFMREQETLRQTAEAERRRAESEERRQHEERMRRLELEAEERRRKDERDREERKAREERERDEARRRDEAEREERRRKDLAEAEARQRQHTEQMLTMVRAQSEQSLSMVKAQMATVTQQNPQNNLIESIKVITAIKEAFGGDGDKGGDEDPLTLLMKHGHEWLNGVGNVARGVIAEVKGNPASAPQLPAPGASEDNLVIPRTSPLAGKLEKLVGTIAQKGQDPERVLAGVVDNLQAVLEGKVSAPPPANAPASPPASAPAPPSPDAPPAPQETVQKTAPPAPAPSPQVPRSQIEVNKSSRGASRISFV